MCSLGENDIKDSRWSLSLSLKRQTKLLKIFILSRKEQKMSPGGRRYSSKNCPYPWTLKILEEICACVGVINANVLFCPLKTESQYCPKYAMQNKQWLDCILCTSMAGCLNIFIIMVLLLCWTEAVI